MLRPRAFIGIAISAIGLTVLVHVSRSHSTLTADLTKTPVTHTQSTSRHKTAHPAAPPAPAGDEQDRSFVSTPSTTATDAERGVLRSTEASRPAPTAGSVRRTTTDVASAIRGDRLASLLPSGNDGQVLMLRHGIPVWTDLPGNANSPSGPVRTDIRAHIVAPEDRPSIRNGGGGGGSQPLGLVQLDGGTEGILPVQRGGTNLTGYSAWDLLVGGTDGGLTKLSLGTQGSVLSSSGGALRWSSSGYLMSLGGWVRDGNGVHLVQFADNVGIGTAMPHAKLDVEGTISGTTLTVGHLNVANLVVNGSQSGNFLPSSDGQFTLGADNARWKAASLSGAGLHIGSSGNETVLNYNTAAGRFGIDTNGDGTPELAILSNGNTGVNTLAPAVKFQVTGSGAFSGNVGIGKVTTAARLEVVGTISGANLYTSSNLTASGGLTVERTSRFKSTVNVAGTMSGSALTVSGYTPGSVLFATSAGVVTQSNALFFWDAANTRLGIRTNSPKTTLEVNGTISGATLYASGNVSASGGLTVEKNSRFKGNLNVVGMISGSTLFAASRLASSGGLTVEGIARFKNGVNVAGTLSGAALTIMNGNSSILGNTGIGASANAKTKLEVVGTISGSLLTLSNPTGTNYMMGNLGIGTTSASSTKLNVAGTMSGRSLSISGTGAFTAATPEIRLLSTGDGYYTRLTRTNTAGKATLYNFVNRPANQYSLSFTSSSNQYVNISSLTSNTYFGSAGTTTFSVSFWFKGASAAGVVIAKGGSTGNGWEIDVGGGTISYTAKNASSSHNSRSSITTINDGNWHHGVVVATIDTVTSGNNTVSIYVDGALNQGSMTNTSGVPALSNDPVTLGVRQNNGTYANYLQGNLSDVRLYSTALSPTEIAAIYNNTSGQTSSPVAWWRLDDGAGSSAADRSGNGYTGTLVNAPAWALDIPGAYSTGTKVETEVWSSQDGQLASEEGINKFGWKLGQTDLRYGTSLKFLLGVSETEIGRFSSGGLLGLGTSAPNAKLSVSGSVIISRNGVSTAAAKAGVGLEVMNTISGSLLTLSNPGGISYNLGSQSIGKTTSKAKLTVYGSGAFTGTLSGSALNIQGGNSYVLGNTVFGGTKTPATKLEVVGTISGSALQINGGSTGLSYVLGNLAIGRTTAKTKLEVAGTMSGTSLTITGTGAAPLINALAPTGKVDINAPLEQGLVAWYTMDTLSGSFVTDSSIYGSHSNSGVLVNTPTMVTGKFGRALSFDGSSNYVSVTNAPGVPTGNSPRTVSAWINATTLSAVTNHFAVAIGTVANNAGFLIGVNTSGQFVVTTAGGANDLVGASAATNTWYHLVGTYDGNGNLGLWVNGVLVGTKNITSTNTANGNVFIGKHTSGEYFNGKIDDVRIYNRRLSAREIADLYRWGSQSNGGTMSGIVIVQGDLRAAGVLSGSALNIQGGNSYVLGNTIFGGTKTPATKLEVVGTISGSALVITGSGTSGPLLVTDKTLGRVSVNGTLENGLVRWWAMDSLSGSTILDSSINAGRTTSGTLVNSPSIVPGKFGRALSFNGSSQYVALNASGLPSAAAARTVSFWFNPSSLPAGNLIPFGYGAGSANDAFYLIIINGSGEKKLCLGKFGGGDTPCTLNGAIAANTWYHAVTTYDGTNASIYLNGQLASTTARTFTTTATAANIGQDFSSYFGGMIDEIRIYNRALSAREVADLYRSGSQSNGGTMSGVVVIQGNLNILNTLSGSALTIQGGASSFLGNVSIGKTTNNTAKLDVLGTISGSLLTLSNPGGISYNLGSQSIGKTTSKAKLTVYGSGAFTGTLSGSALNIQGGNSYILGNTVFGGTKTPSTKLEVVGTISGSALTVMGAGNSYFQNGNVGIGTSVAASKLTVSGAVTISAGCHPNFQNNALNIDECNGVARLQAGNSTPLTLALNGGGGNVSIGKTTNNTAKLDVLGTISGSLLTLSNPSGISYSLGNLSIGKTTSTAKLDVAGTISGSTLLVGVGSATSPSIAFNGNANMGLFQSGANVLGFSVGGLQRMRISSYGAVEIGTQSSGAMLRVKAGNTALKGLVVQGSKAQPSLPVTTGLQMWLKADSLGLSDGTAVSSWTDLSGNGNNATQATGGNQPTYKTNIVNGKPVVRFNGTSNFLTTPSLTNKTIFIVAKFSDGATFTNNRRLFDATDDSYQLLGNNGATTLSHNVYINGAFTGDAAPLSTWKVISDPINGGAVAMRIGSNLNGTGQYFNGDMAEVIVYNSVLSTSDRQAVESYLWQKYMNPNPSNLQEWQDGSGAVLNVVTASGALGLGLSTVPTSVRLAVSGAVVISRNGTATANAKSGIGLEVMNTISGSALTVMSGNSYTLGTLGTGTGTGLIGQHTIFTTDAFNNPALFIRSKETTGSQDMIRVITDVSTTGNTVWRVNASGATFADQPYNSGGADYAEWFASADYGSLKSGDLVCVDVTRENGVRKCASSADPNVMGIISTKPSVIGNAVGNKTIDLKGIAVPGYVLVGLIGQIPAKVIVESGAAIRPGDPLTTASLPGYARRANAGEPTVGVALEGLQSGQGVITVLIARSNKSLTTEAVEQKVRENVAALKIDDEIQLSMQKGLQALNLTGAVLKTVQQVQTDQVDQLRAEVARLQAVISTMSGSLRNSLAALELKLQAEHVTPHAAASTNSGSIDATDLTSESTLTVASDARIGGDLYLEGMLKVNRLYVPGGTLIDGGLTVGDVLQAGRIEAGSGSSVHGTLAIDGQLAMATGSSIQMGSGAQIVLGSGSGIRVETLLVRSALQVLGDVTIHGLATFLGDVTVQGNLTLSTRQAGTAVVPAGSTSVLVTFGSGGFRSVPVITASSDDFTPWRIVGKSGSGFSIEVQTAPAHAIHFDWTALLTAAPVSGTPVETAAPDTPVIAVPVDASGIPVSSDAVWNNCIRRIPTMGANGQPLSCSRYVEGNTWQHPDLHISFTFRDDLTPPVLVLPEGYRATVTAASSASSTSSAASAAATSSAATGTGGTVTSASSSSTTTSTRGDAATAGNESSAVTGSSSSSTPSADSSSTSSSDSSAGAATSSASSDASAQSSAGSSVSATESSAAAGDGLQVLNP